MTTAATQGYDALAVANWFLDRAAADEPPRPIDHLKLQKLAYIAHGWSLAVNDRPLFFQDVQAWPYGPVIPDVYRAFRLCRNRPIGGRATVACDDGTRVPARADFDPQTRSLLETVWETYKEYDGLRLSGMTHNHDTPWTAVTKGKFRDEYAGTPIKDDDIKQYYVELAAKRRRANVASAS